ncbi:proline--tRNA ligase [Candidatus Woesearchaeota archaeon]|nr:proline--tRNA ligase [Candidatus Woesearchaeota archaeon]
MIKKEIEQEAKIPLSNELTAKKSDFSNWYTQVVHVAGILDQRFEAKGENVWKGYGYKAMNNIKAIWDKLFQDAGIEEYYFPLIVPLEYAKQNDSWWKGFETEGYQVIAGEDKKVQGILRPTGEPAMYPMFSLWVRSSSDLPIRLYETVSSYRYETKHTRPLIRDREITVWHEIHTAHATRSEAEEEMELHMRLWDQMWNDLALPVFKVKKPIWECFPGAVGAVEYYSTTPNGRVMENGSVNNLGQAYAKKFNIKFTDKDGQEKYVWQLCTGNGARLLAAVFTIHGDDHGLIMPPKIAPFKAVIIPILKKGEEDIVNKKALELYEKLKTKFPIKLDSSEKSPGKKFYEWEIKGVPIRIEIGPKDIAEKSLMLVRRDTFEKIKVKEAEVDKKIESLLQDIHKNLLDKATKMLNSQLAKASSLEEIKKNINNQKISIAFWCNDEKCYDKISKVEDGVEGFGSDLNESESGKCIVCNKQTKTRLYVAKSY